MTSILRAVVDSLPHHVSLAKLQPIIWRLMATGVVARTASAREAEMYDRAADAGDVLAEIFEVLGIPLQHDGVAQTFRVFTPGAQIPGHEKSKIEPYGRLTMAVPTDLAALLIALWLLYREGVERSLLNDQGERVVTLNDLEACLVTQLRTPLLNKLTERRELLAQLRQMRVVRLPEDTGVNLEADDALAIQRGILSLVFESAAEAALLLPAAVADEVAP